MHGACSAKGNSGLSGYLVHGRDLGGVLAHLFGLIARLLLLQLLGWLALACFSQGAHALVQPVVGWFIGSGTYNTDRKEASTQEGVCAAIQKQAEENYPEGWGTPAYRVGMEGSTPVCYLSRWGAESGSVIGQTAPACPANSTASGGACQCNTPAYQEGTGAAAGMCVPKDIDCLSKTGTPYSPASTRPLGAGDTLPQAGVAALQQPVPSCVDKCGVAGGGLRAERSFARTWTLIVPALNYTGGSCTQSSGDLVVNNKWDNEIVKDAEPPTPCPAGKSPGEINGVSVCMPSSATASSSSTSQSSSGDTVKTGGDAGGTNGTNGNGTGSGASTIGTSGPSNSSDTSITSCDGTSCTTTTTKTSTSSSSSSSSSESSDCAQKAAAAASAAGNTGATCTNTTTTTKPQADYCKENPKVAACAGDSSKTSFTGNCAAGFQTTGDDAVQQAMAKEIFTRNCQFFSTDGPNSTAYAGYAQMTGKQTGNLPGNVTKDLGTLDQTDLLGSGSGVSDMSVTVMGQSATFSMSQINSTAQMLGYILLAVTAIACVMIVFGD